MPKVAAGWRYFQFFLGLGPSLFLPFRSYSYPDPHYGPSYPIRAEGGFEILTTNPGFFITVAGGVTVLGPGSGMVGQQDSYGLWASLPHRDGEAAATVRIGLGVAF